MSGRKCHDTSRLTRPTGVSMFCISKFYFRYSVHAHESEAVMRVRVGRRPPTRQASSELDLRSPTGNTLPF